MVRRREAQEEERRREEAQRLRAFLAAVQATPLKDKIDGMPAEDWLNWLRWRIDKLDPLASSLEDGG